LRPRTGSRSDCAMRATTKAVSETPTSTNDASSSRRQSGASARRGCSPGSSAHASTTSAAPAGAKRAEK
jgi:hypothetical protein